MGTASHRMYQSLCLLSLLIAKLNGSMISPLHSNWLIKRCGGTKNVASAGLASDRAYCEHLGGEFTAGGLSIFVSGKSGDATSERLDLPFPGLPGMTTRSSWHVYVSQQQFYCKQAGRAWCMFECSRPNVSVVVTETGESLHGSMHHLEQKKPFHHSGNGRFESSRVSRFTF